MWVCVKLIVAFIAIINSVLIFLCSFCLRKTKTRRELNRLTVWLTMKLNRKDLSMKKKMEELACSAKYRHFWGSLVHYFIGHTLFIYLRYFIFSLNWHNILIGQKMLY